MCSTPLTCPVFLPFEHGQPINFITSTSVRHSSIILVWLFHNKSEITYLNLLCDGFPNDIPVYKNQNFMTIWRRRVYDTTTIYTHTRTYQKSVFIFVMLDDCVKRIRSTVTRVAKSLHTRARVLNRIYMHPHTNIWKIDALCLCLMHSVTWVMYTLLLCWFKEDPNSGNVRPLGCGGICGYVFGRMMTVERVRLFDVSWHSLVKPLMQLR